uniref:Endonuclease/exonuclease/phosphatase domain-containing protein n=1 Tax=Nelumbo nucifera TaxID=4432 RepID=A0A822XWM4_NELNU|nr:TPA_asm: hypothetical protein HUJ06_025616 [Nelumbo nucifera]
MAMDDHLNSSNCCTKKRKSCFEDLTTSTQGRVRLKRQARNINTNEFDASNSQILIWNCQGGSRLTVLYLNRLLSKHHLDIFFIFETKNNLIKSKAILRHLHNYHVEVILATGRSGGLWFGYSKNVLLSIFSITDHSIYCTVKNRPHCLEWDLLCFYVHPSLSARTQFRDEIKSFLENSTRPWCICGDLNLIVSSNEKQGGCAVSRGETSLLSQAISECNLIDLGSSSPPFTWTNRRDESHLISKRLDRFLANQDWIHEFPHVHVRKLASCGSDHHPILLSTKRSWQNSAQL